MTGCVPLSEVEDEKRYGGKSVSLGRAIRSGLPVPPGFALSVDMVDAVAAHDETSLGALEDTCFSMGDALAVRSSAVGEDAKDASFAGQHVTVLNVRTPDALSQAVREVYNSAHTASALGYRKKMGIEDPPRIAVVLQQMVESESAGVLFTRNPATGAEERVIEAAWGLGEAVVSGLVVPDSYRVGSDGEVLEVSIGEKDIYLRSIPGGGTEEVPVQQDRVRTRVLDDARLGDLHRLTLRCEEFYGSGLDIEWAFSQGLLFLLQCRSITRVGG